MCATVVVAAVVVVRRRRRQLKKTRIFTDDLPPRSPEFNGLDYSLWRAINAGMREQETNFSAKKKETKAAYLERLRRTILGLPPMASVCFPLLGPSHHSKPTHSFLSAMNEARWLRSLNRSHPKAPVHV